MNYGESLLWMSCLRIITGQTVPGNNSAPSLTICVAVSNSIPWPH